MNKLFIITLVALTIAIAASEKKSPAVQQIPQGLPDPVAPTRQKSRRHGGLIYVSGTQQIVRLHDGFEIALPGDKFPDETAVEKFKASIRQAIRDCRVEKQVYCMVAYSFHYHGSSFHINNVIEDYNNGVTACSLKDIFQALHTLLAEDPFRLTTTGKPIPDYVLECLAASNINVGRTYRSPFSGRAIDLAKRGQRIDSGEITDDEGDNALPAYHQVVATAASSGKKQ